MRLHAGGSHHFMFLICRTRSRVRTRSWLRTGELCRPMRDGGYRGVDLRFRAERNGPSKRLGGHACSDRALGRFRTYEEPRWIVQSRKIERGVLGTICGRRHGHRERPGGRIGLSIGRAVERGREQGGSLTRAAFAQARRHAAHTQRASSRCPGTTRGCQAGCNLATASPEIASTQRALGVFVSLPRATRVDRQDGGRRLQKSPATQRALGVDNPLSVQSWCIACVAWAGVALRTDGHPQRDAAPPPPDGDRPLCAGRALPVPSFHVARQLCGG